jgi:predicted MPP superfamily phosphohydrolase
LPANLKTPHPSAALAIVITLIIIQVYGTWNAHHPVVNHYDLKVAQKCNNLTSLRVVMVSDIHLGWIVGVDRLRDMAATINSLNPDLVLLAGDIVDEGVDLSAEEEIPQAFAALRPQLGTFAVLATTSISAVKQNQWQNTLNKEESKFCATSGFNLIRACIW